MKNKLLGIKKDVVEQSIQRIDSWHNFEIQKLELEYVTIKRENENLLEQIREKERERKVSLETYNLVDLTYLRLESVITVLQQHTEKEIAMLRKKSEEKIMKLERELKKLDAEIDAVNQVFGRILYQFDQNAVEPVQSISKQPTNKYQSEEAYIPEEIQEEMPVQNEIDINAVQDLGHSSDPLLEEIDTFQMEYLLGKVNGEDIFDDNGKLLIAKNTRISKEVIEMANAESKLAELIVNLKISSVGEE